MSGFAMDEDNLAVRSGLSSQVKNMAEGNGGVLQIKTNNLTITDGAFIDLSNFGYGTGAALDIDADSNVTLSGFSVDDTGRTLKSNITCYAYRDGDTGDIDLVADYFFTDHTSVIEASSQLGIDGAINIDTPNIDLSASFVSLPEYTPIPDLTRTSCESMDRETDSSLVKTGRGGLPQAP